MLGAARIRSQAEAPAATMSFEPVVMYLPTGLAFGHDGKQVLGQLMIPAGDVTVNDVLVPDELRGRVWTRAGNPAIPMHTRLVLCAVWESVFEHVGHLPRPAVVLLELEGMPDREPGCIGKRYSDPLARDCRKERFERAMARGMSPQSPVDGVPVLS